VAANSRLKGKHSARPVHTVNAYMEPDSEVTERRAMLSAFAQQLSARRVHPRSQKQRFRPRGKSLAELPPRTGAGSPMAEGSACSSGSGEKRSDWKLFLSP